MAQTKEEKRIKYLEKRIEEQKEAITRHLSTINGLRSRLQDEREWRKDFKSLLDRAMEWDKKELEQEYWYEENR